MAAQKDGFNVEEIDTPDAVLRVSDECQPGRTIGTRLGSKVFWQARAARHLCRSRCQRRERLRGDADTTELRIAALHLDDGRDELRARAFRAKLSLRHEEENSRRYFRWTNALCNLNNVAGSRLADSFGMRCGLTKRVVSPSTRRSSVVRFGARCRERLLISQPARGAHHNG
jgi:hypothetical protein